MNRKRTTQRSRDGVVAVEFAIAAAILFLVVAASLEFSRMNMIRHTVDNAAYEAARAGIVLGADENAVRQTAEQIMGTVRARDVSVNIDPSVIQDDTPEIVVTVTVPADSNGYITSKFFTGKSFVGSCRLSRDDI